VVLLFFRWVYTYPSKHCCRVRPNRICNTGNRAVVNVFLSSSDAARCITCFELSSYENIRSNFLLRNRILNKAHSEFGIGKNSHKIRMYNHQNCVLNCFLVFEVH
jgi:hypothetical protein